MMGRHAGWIPIEDWGDKYRHHFCETEKHAGTFTRAIAVAALTDPPLVWGVCRQCLKGLQDEGFPLEPLAK